VELNVLADGDVCDTISVFGGESGDGADLMAGEETIGNADADHEERNGAAFATRAANDAEAVALRVNTPRTEIGAKPLRGNGRVALASEFADFVEVLPGIFLALETLDPLGLGFFDFQHLLRIPFQKQTRETAVVDRAELGRSSAAPLH
jgi:hypothetical protein